MSFLLGSCSSCISTPYSPYFPLLLIELCLLSLDQAAALRQGMNQRRRLQSEMSSTMEREIAKREPPFLYKNTTELNSDRQLASATPPDRATMTSQLLKKYFTSDSATTTPLPEVNTYNETQKCPEVKISIN